MTCFDACEPSRRLRALLIWEIVFVLVILKLPVAYVCWVIWWAVKSEPELSELVESEPRLQGKGVAVSMSEKGFGTRVAIAAGADAGLSESDLESLLDQLAEPQKRPFSNS